MKIREIFHKFWIDLKSLSKNYILLILALKKLFGTKYFLLLFFLLKL